MLILRECSKGFVVVGKIHPGQGNQKGNCTYTGFGA